MSYNKTIWKSKDIITREKMQKIEDQLEVLSEQGTSGTSDYLELENKPQINGVTLTGNKSLTDLGAAAASDVAAKYTKPGTGIPASDLSSTVQASLNKADTALQGENLTSVVNNYIETNFSNPSSPPLDRTLSTSSSAAPADMVGDLKSAIDENNSKLGFSNNAFDKTCGVKSYEAGFVWENGSINSNGDVQSDFAIRTPYIDFLEQTIIAVSIDASYRYFIVRYNSSKQYQSISDWYTSAKTFTSESDGYIRVVVGKRNKTEVTPADNSNCIITITKAIVNRITEINNEIEAINNGGYIKSPFEYTNGGYIDDYNGNVVSYANWKYTDYIAVNPNTNKLKIIMLNASSVETTDGNIYNAWYNENKQYIKKLTITNDEIVIPESAHYIRLSCRSSYNQILYLYRLGIDEISAMVGQTDGEYLKVLSWNVGIFGDGTTKPTTADSANQIIKMKKMAGEVNADIINAQEYVDYVDDSNTIRSANILSFKYNNKVSASANKSFSKVGIKNYETITFTSGSNRPCIAYNIDFNGKTITIINAHLSIEANPSTYRTADIAQLVAYMETKDYVILSGDFNVASDSEFDAFKTAGFKLCNGGDFGWFDTWPVMANMPSGWSTDWPCNHLDNIIVSNNIVPQFVKTVEVGVSDHAPIYAELKID